MSDQSPDAFVTFGELLRYLRRRARLTQRELGVAVGYSESYVTRLESNTRTPIPGMVEARFLDALQVAVGSPLAQRLVALAVLAHRATDTTAKSAAQTNLRRHLTHYIGQDHALTEVRRLIASGPIVTLTGPGGVGKTRMAQEAASAMLNQFEDGVWLIELASLNDPGLIMRSIAKTLSLPNAPLDSSTGSLCAHLACKQMLLVLDNCEHLIHACAELVEALSMSCPGLKILATSREPLHIPGEVTWLVSSLDVSDSTLLFGDRAQLARPAFAITEQNRPAVETITRSLDGIPLAIELAAARMTGLSVEQLAARIADRFRLLADGSRTALPRHQTLRQLIDWSHILLTDQEQILFRRLSVFVGNFTAESAEHVCVDHKMGHHAESSLYGPNVLPLLLSLVNKSLVAVEEDEGEVRYRLLETIRVYAQEHLAANDEVELLRQQHASYFLQSVQDSAPLTMRQSGSPLQFVLAADSERWCNVLRHDHDNLRAALRWCLGEGKDIHTGIQLTQWLNTYWHFRGYCAEAAEWLGAALVYIDAATLPQIRVRVLTALVDAANVIGDYVTAQSAAEEALAISRHLDSDHELMRSLQMSAHNLMCRGYHADALPLLEEWHSRTVTTGNRHQQGIVLFWLGIVAMHMRNFALAAAHHEEALQVIPAEEAGTRIATQYYLAEVWRQQGDDLHARTQIEAALDYFRRSGFVFGTANALHSLGDIAFFQGDVSRAKDCYIECLKLLHWQGARQRIAWPLAGLAALAAIEGRWQAALTLWAATSALRTATGSIYQTMSHAAYQLRIDLARQEIDPRMALSAAQRGQTLSLEQAVAFALDECD